MAGKHGSAREEAERLVATVLAMASQAGVGRAGSGLGEVLRGLVDQAAGADTDQGWATGSAACCVCPVCRIIAGLRDPDPATVERFATGAGDFAAGVASLLRSLSEVAAPGKATAARPQPEPDVIWRAATAQAAANQAATAQATADQAGTDRAAAESRGTEKAGDTAAADDIGDVWRAATHARPVTPPGPGDASSGGAS